MAFWLIGKMTTYFPGVHLDSITDEEFAMLSEEALWLHQQVLVSRLTLQPPSP